MAALFGLPALNRRLDITRLSWLLALAPLSALVILAARVPQANAGVVTVWQWTWLPSLGLNLGLYVDDLSLFFGLIITFIGTLIIIYTGQYFKGDQGAWRFLTYLLLFMVSMLGIVLAGDVLTLFIFWEGTSILSFLLVAYKTELESARRGAFRALLITGGGGIALLLGVLFLSYVAGGTDFVTILSRGDVLRSSEFYGLILALVALGAFTKSAQFPFHFWLPGAMSAPTPASAYLHSATMVKAGIYLLARLNPALGFTETWFWLLTIAGGITMLTGAYLGLKQNDLKALLAYSTISQLGILVMLIGQDIAIAYKALIIGILAHALYKSALFLVAGIVDHETGTRDMRRLGGLAKVMPFTFTVAFLAALSMAGLPPMFGFLAKETLLAAAVHPTLPPIAAELIRWAAVIAGALMLAQAGLLIWETFLGKAKDPDVHGHEAPIPMWLAPAIPATLSIILVILPGPKEEAALLSGAAQAAYGDAVKVSFVLFHGLTVELLLSSGRDIAGHSAICFPSPGTRLAGKTAAQSLPKRRLSPAAERCRSQRHLGHALAARQITHLSDDHDHRNDRSGRRIGYNTGAANDAAVRQTRLQAQQQLAIAATVGSGGHCGRSGGNRRPQTGFLGHPGPGCIGPGGSLVICAGTSARCGTGANCGRHPFPGDPGSGLDSPAPFAKA